jgi:hypothetical protein
MKKSRSRKNRDTVQFYKKLSFLYAWKKKVREAEKERVLIFSVSDSKNSCGLAAAGQRALW